MMKMTLAEIARVVKPSHSLKQSVRKWQPGWHLIRGD